jgi:hypothetical protein
MRVDSILSEIVGDRARAGCCLGSALLFDMTVFLLANGRRWYFQRPLFSPLFLAVIPVVPPLLFNNSGIAHKLLIMIGKIDRKIQHNSGEK